MNADVLVIGSGLAGLVSATEAASNGARVVVVDQEGEQDLGGQAWWSFGGLFFIDSPEQRQQGIKDSLELAYSDWMGSAAFEDHDTWPRRWAEAYLNFAHHEKRAWLQEMGHQSFPMVGWAERGDGSADGHGNSVPRFHITWGTGPGIVEPFLKRAEKLVTEGRLRFLFRHRVEELIGNEAGVTGARGSVLAPTDTPRGVASNRDVIGDFTITAQATIVASGGIGANHELVKRNWPSDLLTPPESMVSGVPAYVDGHMIPISQRAGAHLLNPTRMWHYTEGLKNWNPVWENHGIRVLSGPSPLWLTADGHRLPPHLFPGFNNLGVLGYLRDSGHDYSWLLLNQRILETEIMLSGSEQNPGLTNRDMDEVLGKHRTGASAPLEAFKQHGEDWVVADSVRELVDGMNRVTGDSLISFEQVAHVIESRDAQTNNEFSKDAQLHAIRQARQAADPDRIRVAPVHRLTEPSAGPLIAVRLHILTRKTLGGLHTDLDARVLAESGSAIPGFYAAGEAAGFGGGGMHGHNALEGSFLGGCLFTGRTAGRVAANATA